MTSVLACRMSKRFAAFGAVAVVVGCGGTRPVPIMGFAGTADPVVPFNGGTGELLRRRSRSRARHRR